LKPYKYVCGSDIERDSENKKSLKFTNADHKKEIDEDLENQRIINIIGKEALVNLMSQ
jgi:hypothetical protein